MSKRIQIVAGPVEMLGELNDSETVQRLLGRLPAEGSASTWGHEIYFPVPLQITETPDARDELQVGEIAYWPPGQTFCIFFGPTPASDDGHPRAASPVNPLGRVLGDPIAFADVRDGDRVIVRLAQ